MTDNQDSQDLYLGNNSYIQNFQPPTNHYHCIFIHRLTSTDKIITLIDLASKTYNFIIDTQYQIDLCSDAQYHIPSLIQIQFHSPLHLPVVLLIEVLYLKTKFTTRLRNLKQEQKIKELFKEIFSPKKNIFAWGNPKEQLLNFYQYELFNDHDLDYLNFYDIQKYFKHWYESKFDYPMMQESYSLQTAILLVFDEWLDTRMKYAAWNSGIDIELQTYYWNFLAKLDKNYQNFIHKQIQYRQQMQTYAIYNCLAITKLMSLMFKQGLSLTDNFKYSCQTLV